jgi:hypothetical protein
MLRRSPKTPVCPSCGTIVADEETCPTCGEDLAQYEKLPLADEWQSEAPYRDALVVIRRCRVLGGTGLGLQPGDRGELIFESELVRLRGFRGDESRIAYDEVTAIEIGGQGSRRQGGGFFGGGFGLEGAAEGLLIATALNMLTTRTTMDAVICIQTLQQELFLQHADASPDNLRIKLSPVLTILRRNAAPFRAGELAPERAADHVERLVELGRLLERGLISEQEFQRLKSDLLK